MHARYRFFGFVPNIKLLTNNAHGTSIHTLTHIYFIKYGA